MATRINQAAITSINPATKQVLGEVQISSAAEIDQIVAKAKTAQSAWRKEKLERRLEFVEQFRQLLLQSKEELAKLITNETGKPRVEALAAEIFGVLETTVWLQKRAPALLAPKPVELNALMMPGKRSYNVPEPLGTIAVISPFNYPFSIPVSTMLTALVAGNAVVLKPSPKTALIAQAAVNLFRRAGFPADLVGLIQGDRAEVEQLIESDVQRVVFTGSTGGGKAIMSLAAKKALPVTLELGGKHAAIVLKDSDLDAIARPLLWAAFTNAGQACASIERLYVEREIAQALKAKLADLAKQLRLGDGLLPDIDVGPVIDEQQLLRVHEQVLDAVAQGAELLAGGRVRDDLGGFFYEPTVLGNVHPDMRVVREEIFGPVLPIIEVADEAEAIEHVNRSTLGLCASIWTPDTERAERLARDIDAGIVWINDGLFTHVSPDAPWGGIKESGFGRLHSAAELMDLVYLKNIGIGKQAPQEWNYPYGESALDYVRGGLDFMHGPDVVSKLHGLKKVIRAWFQKRSGR